MTIGTVDEGSDARRSLLTTGLSRRGASERGRLQVLEGAAEAFNKRGYAATSIDDIAEVLESTKGRIYHYYRSKADIFLDVLTLSLGDLLARIKPIAARDDLAPDRRLAEAARMHATVMMTQSALSRVAIQGAEMHLMQNAGVKQRAALDVFIAMRDEYEQYFASIIDEGVQAGYFREVRPRVATKPVLGALNWINMWYRPGHSGPPIDEIAEEFATFVVNGLRPTPRRRRR
jgi:AcrR family transcriptional regulator